MIGNLFGTTGRSGQTVTSYRLLGRAAVVLLLAVGFGLTTAGRIMAAAGCDGCAYKREIKIASNNLGGSCSANVTNFPVLVSISYDSLRSDVGHVKNSNGYDIAFTDADGNWLNHEVEHYVSNEGTLVAWVNVPVLSNSPDTETVIYMYYGDSSIENPLATTPSAVWDADYKGVWHLNQQPTGDSGDIWDSTGVNHGQSFAMDEGDTALGRIGWALEFDGVKDMVNIGDPLDGADSETISAWVKHDELSDDVQRYVRLGDANELRHDGNNSVGQVHYYAKDQHDNFEVIREYNALTPGDWYYVVGTWSYPGSTMKLYINGVNVATEAHANKKLGPSGTSYISATFTPMDGIIDEVRVSGIPRDACWIETEYNNQNNPAAFHAIGDEEGTDLELETYEITVTSGANGSIILAAGDGEIVDGVATVNQGATPLFYLSADDDYQVATVVIGGVPLEDQAIVHYEFEAVTTHTGIAVTFELAPEEVPVDIDEVEPGCSQSKTTDYSAGFDPDDLEIVNTVINDDYYVYLDTGNQAIDPNKIVLPFDQAVTVCFLYEGAGDRSMHFGWMLASEGINGTKHEIYDDINDNDYGPMSGNGVLDESKTDTGNRFGDRNGDGPVNALDNCEVIDTFEAGTELVFWLSTEYPADSKRYRDFDYGDYGDPVYWYTKTAWNQDKYTSTHGDLNVALYEHGDWWCDYEWGDPFVKTYLLGQPRTIEGTCLQSSGWMDQGAIDRASIIFKLNFEGEDQSSLSIPWHSRYPAVMVGAPADNQNAWVLGFENSIGGGDTDHNDVVFVIERETGGTAELKSAAAITPDNADATIRGVTLDVWDYIPGVPCITKTEINYKLSIDAGTTWVEVDEWDDVYEFNLVDGEKILLDRIVNWQPGTPAYTHRTRRVDFSDLGLSGSQLIWHAEFKSRQEGCEPMIMGMTLDLTTSAPGLIARSSPTVLANVMYSAGMETPIPDWDSTEYRGHLKSTLIYHQQYPNHTFDDEDYPADPNCQDDPGWTDCPVLWDAGEVLTNDMDPGDRTIYMPDVTVQVVAAEQLAVGDGETTTFSGQLAHYPVLATTVRISDTTETFSDRRTAVLDGDRGGSGTINRFTGRYSLTFDTAPNENQPITAAYSHFTYNAGGTLRTFTENAVSGAELALDDSSAVPSGYLYDFDEDGDYIAANDANWLISWTRGFLDGSTKTVEKEWPLGALDHSVPALATPPASASWYYGTAIPEDDPSSTNDRAGYRDFRDAQAERRTVVYVGGRDGMLHAFDGGDFRWGDNPCTASIVENRGYFQWNNNGGNPNCHPGNPDYGTGQELWAFIPANLLPRLKNNYLQGDDRSYVDASPALADVHTGGQWRTVLLSAEGNGGDTVFCLDVTDPDAPEFMWEFAEPFLFRSRSSPAVAKIGRIYHDGTAKWVAFFVSGKTFDDTLYPSIFTIDIADGSLLEKIDMDAVPAGAGGVLSGQPAIVDSDGNGYVDRLYIGSDKGLLYKINMPDDPSTVKDSIGHCVINTDFSDDDNNSVNNDYHYQPIYGSPTVVSSNSVHQTGQMIYDIRIFFGTGDSPYFDEDIDFDDTRYIFYAYRDTAAKGQCDDSQVALDWFYVLPKGHRIYASAFAAAGNIYFGTSTGETEDPCDLSANNDDDFDANAGKLFAFDIDKTTNDPLLEIEVGNVLAAPVIEDKHVYVQTVGGDVDSFGSGQYNNATRQGGIPRIEIHWWREMF
jgi:type IV pilus assembly protein PilY1